jgi:hypothetical protein
MYTLSADESAGIVDLFDALTRDELETAIDELAFKHDATPDTSIIDACIESYHLVEYDAPSVADNSALLVVGPTAFPVIPDGGLDLPHIMDIETRQIDWQQLSRAVEERFRRETARSLAEEDRERVTHLLDVSYAFEAWGSVELTDVRERLDAANELNTIDK